MHKTIKHAVSVLYSDKAWVFDQSEHAQGPIYILKINTKIADCRQLPSFPQIFDLYIKIFLVKYCIRYRKEKKPVRKCV